MTIADPRGTNGLDPSYRRDVDTFLAAGTIAANDLVAFVMSTDGEISVAAATTGTHDPAVKVGVALEAGVANDYIAVVTRGPAVVNTPAAGPAVSELLILTATAGVGDGVAADATTVVGDTHGVFLSDEIGTSNTCWVWID